MTACQGPKQENLHAMTRIYSEIYDDVYFSVLGGLAEKKHVFLGGNDLPARWAMRNDFVVAEAGFGTGLNFLCAAQEFLATTTAPQRLHFVSFEGHPFTPENLRTALNHWRSELGPMIDDLVDHLPRLVPGFHRIILWDRVFLTLVIGDINFWLPQLSASVDAWFLDGFTPAKNPAMWSAVVFDNIQRLSANGATAATYSAARVVKDGLARAGFVVERARGFGAKQDMTVARFAGTAANLAHVRHGLRVAVHGGGVAATSAAYALKQYGHSPVIVAPNGLADAASGNPRGLYNPRFSRDFTPLAQLYASGFAALQQHARRHADAVGWASTGALHLVRDDDTREKFTALATSWGWGPDDTGIVDAHAASDIAGLPIKGDALWLPHAGSVDPRKLCAFYASGIEVLQTAPDDIDVQILATGAGMMAHPALAHIPLQTVRGQISIMRANPHTAKLRTNLCYSGYLSPAVNGVHVLGSTFQHWLHDLTLRPEDHVYVRDRLRDHTGLDFGPDDVIDGRASFRVSARDRAPIIGPVGDQDGLSTYVSTAHGSHGIITSLIGAYLLADQISNLPLCLPDGAVKAVSPQRG